ncbi:MAG: MFS transporter, partial [Candidatus Puniceispirillaceae bacterium]
MSSTQPSSPSSMFAPWVMVLIAGSCIVTVTLGIRQVFGLFMVPISNELGTGLQTFSLAIAAQNLLWGASSPFFGALADRIGAWKVAALGALIYSAGLLFTALMVTETGIFLGQMLIGIGMGSAGISIALGAVARAVPPEKRSLAFGMVTSFGSFGQFALLPITQLLIGGYGWQMALILLSVLTGAMMAVALGMRGDKPGSASDVAAVTTGEALQLAVRSRDYLLLTTGFFVCGLQLVFITTHLPVYLEDHAISGNIASWSLALVGLFNILGAFICGWLGGRSSKRKTLASVYLLRALVIAAFVITPPSATSALIFGAAMGLLWLGT